MSEKEEDRNKMFKLLITVGIIMTVTLLCTIFILKQNNEWTSLMWFFEWGKTVFSKSVSVIDGEWTCIWIHRQRWFIFRNGCVRLVFARGEIRKSGMG